MTTDAPNVCVFTPALFLTVTVESLAGHEELDDLHFHPGGQGFWIARMLQDMEERPLLVAPVGGEPGRVLRGLAPAWRIELSPVEIEDRLAALDDFVRRGVERVVLSSSHATTVAGFGGRRLRAEHPVLEPADPRGSGDSMTAGLVSAALRGLDPVRTVQVACAAGAANATRHGLGSVDAALVERLADRVEGEELVEDAR